MNIQLTSNTFRSQRRLKYFFSGLPETSGILTLIRGSLYRYPIMNNKILFILLDAVLLSGAMHLLARFGFETFISDAATRLVCQVRDESADLRRSGAATRTFEHRPRSWPDGIARDYRIEITETYTSRGRATAPSAWPAT